jgi:hypothetical protein
MWEEISQDKPRYASRTASKCLFLQLRDSVSPPCATKSVVGSWILLGIRGCWLWWAWALETTRKSYISSGRFFLVNYNPPEPQITAHIAHQTLTLALLPSPAPQLRIATHTRHHGRWPLRTSSAMVGLPFASDDRSPSPTHAPSWAPVARFRGLPVCARCTTGRPPVRHGQEGGKSCKHHMIPTFPKKMLQHFAKCWQK